MCDFQVRLDDCEQEEVESHILEIALQVTVAIHLRITNFPQLFILSRGGIL